jgi:uncharacterized tellurite resistance protein B-like protein
MIDYLKKILLQKDDDKLAAEMHTNSEEGHTKKVQIATAALFVEMAKADGHFSEDERKKIILGMQELFNLDKEAVNDLIELSEEQLKESVSMYEFTSIINDNFLHNDKIELIQNLWKLIYSDDMLDKYEDRLMKLFRGMLQLDHKDVIDAKVFIKKQKEN